jgi:hypothetical protein
VSVWATKCKHLKNGKKNRKTGHTVRKGPVMQNAAHSVMSVLVTGYLHTGTWNTKSGGAEPFFAS